MGPSPATFIGACVALGTMTVVQYRRNESNRFQKPLLEAGSALSLLSSLDSGSIAASVTDIVVALSLVAILCPLLSQAAEAARYRLSVDKGPVYHELLAWTQDKKKQAVITWSEFDILNRRCVSSRVSLFWLLYAISHSFR